MLPNKINPIIYGGLKGRSNSYDDMLRYIDINHIAAIANSRGNSLFRVDDPPQIAIHHPTESSVLYISLGVVIGCIHHKNSRDKSKACPKKPVRKDFLERLVIDTTLDVALRKENIQSIAADLCAWQQRQKDTAILDGLKSRRRECEKAIDNLRRSRSRRCIPHHCGEGKR